MGAGTNEMTLINICCNAIKEIMSSYNKMKMELLPGMRERSGASRLAHQIAYERTDYTVPYSESRFDLIVATFLRVPRYHTSAIKIKAIYPKSLSWEEGHGMGNKG